MAILANTPQEELDTAVMLNAGVVRVTFHDQVFGVSIQQVHLGRGDIDCVSIISTGSVGGQIRRTVREKLAEHKSMVGFRVIARDADVLVHVESDYVFEPGIANS